MMKMKTSDGAIRNQAAAKRYGIGESLSWERISAGNVRSRRREDDRREDLVPREDEGEDGGRRQARQRQRQHDLEERGRGRAAERQRRLLQIARDADEDAAGDEHGERERQRGVHQRDAPDRVVDPPLDEGDGQRNREDHDREGPRREDGQAERVAPREDEAGDRVAGGRADDRREDQRHDRHEHAAAERRQDALGIDEEVHRLGREFGRGQILRVAVDDRARAEGGDRDQVDRGQHPERQEDRRHVGQRAAEAGVAGPAPGDRSRSAPASAGWDRWARPAHRHRHPICSSRVGSSTRKRTVLTIERMRMTEA